MRDVAKWISIGFTGVVIVLVLLAFARVGIIYWLYSSAHTFATQQLGLDYYGAQLAAVSFVAIETGLWPASLWSLLLGKRKGLGAVGIISAPGLAFVLVHTVGQCVCFDRQTGAPLCWYVDLPEGGKEFSLSPGFHPVLGKPDKQYT